MDNNKKDAIWSFVSEMTEHLKNKGWAAEKAVWRHAFASQICGDIKAWGLLQRDLPDALKGRGEYPSYEEKAVYMALSAFAARENNAAGVSLGTFAARLGNKRDRFTRLENSEDIDILWRNLKDFLRFVNPECGIDYAKLACDLYEWQCFGRTGIARRWEREYYNVDKLMS